MKTKIGILGTGRMAVRLARLFAECGSEVILGSRTVGDDDASKQQFQALVDGSPFRFLDAGRLYNARFVERMTLFAGELGQRQGYFPRMNWRLLGDLAGTTSTKHREANTSQQTKTQNGNIARQAEQRIAACLQKALTPEPVQLFDDLYENPAC